MRIAFMPGSFNPWHEGHGDVLHKALRVFDKIVLLQLSNSSKGEPERLQSKDITNGLWLYRHGKIEIVSRTDVSLVSAIGDYILNENETHNYAIIRGLRNERDFCDEQTLQYAYERMGIKMPIFFIIADRTLVDMSSTLVKEMQKYATRKKET